MWSARHESLKSYYDRVNANEALWTVTGRLAGERDDLAWEPAETKLRAANSEIEAECPGIGMNALDVASYDGRLKQEILERFQARYFGRAGDFRTICVTPSTVFCSITTRRASTGSMRSAGPKERATAAGSLAVYEARSSKGYMPSDAAEEHQDIPALPGEATTSAQYSRFRQGDLTAIDHVTTGPVLSRQLLMEVELDNRAMGYEMSPRTEIRMSDT